MSRITACSSSTWRNLRFRWNDSGLFMSPSRSRLPLRLYLRTVRCRIEVRFFLRQHPVRCLGQAPSNRSDCLPMTSSALHPLVQTTDMAPRVSSPMDHHCVGCLGIRPLQVAIDIGTCASVPNVSSAGMHSWSFSGIPSQMACTGKPLDITNLGENDHTEDACDPPVAS